MERLCVRATASSARAIAGHRLNATECPGGRCRVDRYVAPHTAVMEAWDLSTVHVRPADLSDPADGQAVVELIDLYARDPMGGGRPLDEAVKRRLAETLRAQPQAHILLAMAGSQPVGIAVCMLGFSSFRGRPLLNLHDLAVHPDARGQGVGRRLLAAVEAEARRRGCCRLTLEVRADNVIARRLYQQAGFDAGDPASDAMSFLTKEL